MDLLSTTTPPPRLRFQLVAATFARLVVNTAHRMIYPFLPDFSRGLGVPDAALIQLLSVRGALGMLSPFFGAIPDRLGRRTAMLIGLSIFCVALALVGWLPLYPVFYAAIVLVIFSKFIFDPALQAYLGDRTPYARRGLVIAFSEIGWSGAALVGIPLAGLFIAFRHDWRAPFLPLAGFGLIGGLVLWLAIPHDGPRATTANAPHPNWWAAVWRSPIVLAAMSVGLLISAANESLNAVYARWLERDFGLQVAERGLTLIVIGLAELAGEALVMWLADRWGKRKAIGIGLAASAVAYLALPLLAQKLVFALAGLFFVFITFEFTIVASIPLITELVPEARGTVMSTNVAFYAAGRMLGVQLSGWLFSVGFLWNGVAASLLNLVALGVIILFVRERQ
jgi:MFS transporter, DHA1 family, inner membrane transport protein